MDAALAQLVLVKAAESLTKSPTTYPYGYPIETSSADSGAAIKE